MGCIGCGVVWGMIKGRFQDIFSQSLDIQLREEAFPQGWNQIRACNCLMKDSDLGWPQPAPRSKYLLISWLQWLSAVILEPKKIKSVIVSTFSPSTCHEVMGPDTIILVFWMLSFKPAFSLGSFTFIKRLFSSSSLSAISVVSFAYLNLLMQFWWQSG